MKSPQICYISQTPLVGKEWFPQSGGKTHTLHAREMHLQKIVVYILQMVGNFKRTTKSDWNVILLSN